jgi:thioredoxin reductase
VQLNYFYVFSLMEATIKTEVAIIGAGPTGLSLAAQFVRHRIDFVVIDRRLPEEVHRAFVNEYEGTLKAEMAATEALSFWNQIACRLKLSNNEVILSVGFGVDRSFACHF